MDSCSHEIITYRTNHFLWGIQYLNSYDICYYLFFENILWIIHEEFGLRSLVSLFKARTAFLQSCQDAIANVKSYHAIKIFYVNKMNVSP